MSTILDYFIPIDSVRCQCVFCGKCFLLNSPVELQEKHLETKHPQGFAKLKSVEKEDEPFNQGYTNDEEKSYQIKSKETLQNGKPKCKIRSKVLSLIHI